MFLYLIAKKLPFLHHNPKIKKGRGKKGREGERKRKGNKGGKKGREEGSQRVNKA